MDALGRFGVNNGNCNTTQKTERDKALLSISKAVIFEREGRTLEYARRIQEVDAMSLQVDPTFPFVPGKAHMRSVYTVAGNVKTASCCALTPLLRRAGFPRRLQQFVGPVVAPAEDHYLTGLGMLQATHPSIAVPELR